MKRTRPIFFTILSTILFGAFVFTAPVLHAQQVRGTVRGRVVTTNNEPADNFSVALQGTTYGTITNEDGRFEIKAKPGNYVLVISHIGIKSLQQAVYLTAGQTITLPDFKIDATSTALNEVNISGNKRRYKIDNPSQSLRLNEPLLQVPQNIQVVSNDQIKDQQIFNMLEGVSRNVSGLTMQEHWGNYARINARGDRIAAFRNGMNIEATWGPLTEDMSFVDRIEFVKGPAGFMLANGNPSGFYNVVTKKPTGVKSQSVSFTAGSFNSYRGTADLDGTLTGNGKLQYRLNLMGQLSKSWRPYDFNDRLAIAPVLRYKFDDKNILTAEYTYQYQHMNAFGTAYLFSTNGYASLPRDFTNAPVNSPGSKIKDHSAFLTYEHKFSSKWKATVQGAYFKYIQNAYSYWIDSIHTNGDVYRYIGPWDAVNTNKFGQAFVNGELKTGSVAHRVLGGVDVGHKYYIADYYQSFSLDTTTPFNLNNPDHSPVTFPAFDTSMPLTGRANFDESSQKYQSVYIQDELGFFDQKLRLTLAARYTRAVTDGPYDDPITDKKVTPRVGVSYSIDPTTSVYGVYDQSFIPQAGKVSGAGLAPPISGNNYELGLKRDWFDGKWNTTLSVYQILKNNQLQGIPGSNEFALLGQTKTRGIEFDARGEIVTGLSLMANYAFTDSKISKDADAKNVGNPVPGFAKHITNAWLTYRLQSGSLKGFGLSAGYQWQIDRLPWSLGSGTPDLPNYFRLDAGASYQIKKISLALNVNNILNTYLYSGGHEDYLSPQGKTVYSWQAEAPATVRLSVGYRF